MVVVPNGVRVSSVGAFVSGVTRGGPSSVGASTVIDSVSGTVSESVCDSFVLKQSFNLVIGLIYFIPSRILFLQGIFLLL